MSGFGCYSYRQSAAAVITQRSSFAHFAGARDQDRCGVAAGPDQNPVVRNDDTMVGMTDLAARNELFTFALSLVIDRSVAAEPNSALAVIGFLGALGVATEDDAALSAAVAGRQRARAILEVQ